MRTPMKSVPMILAVAALLVLTSITVVAAQGPGPGGERAGKRGGQGDELRKALGRLDLSEDQKSSIKALFESNKESMQADRETLRTAREALRLQMQSETFNEGAIRNLAGQVGAAEVEMAVARASLHNQIRELLTDEQRGQLKEMQAQRMERMEERREQGRQGKQGRHGQRHQNRNDL
ncbi:MAG: Spy/CpxP family protein refolding chaperone [Acidobacteria bacterium]|uniref:Spy/CpxP family protein refolding chaperone n=1 Tax=Candidatus Polarisedimenticola svalbardensis TaxID=2886004 RepID=A0A8J6XVV7_9BACT|nr:Spy/CpxP family protein refolding chaperone [Candidatus Polarisedimenticola svalbardensis]